VKKHSSFSQDTTQKAATISGIAEGAGTDLNQPLPEPVPPTVQQSNKVEAGPPPSVSKSTGPKTAQGKNRSKLNALKHGLLFKGVLLRGESPSKYLSLLDGLRAYWQPQGTTESVEVENLVAVQWRKGRLFEAENAVIIEQIALPESDSLEKQQRHALELSRDSVASGGLLMHCDNRFVIPEAIATLKLLRQVVNQLGFVEDNRLVAKL